MSSGGKQHVVTPNLLDRQFDPLASNQAWVTDITDIKTHEGWLYPGTVMDLFSLRIIGCIIGWSMGSRMTKGLVLDALLMAVWRRKPKESVLVHSDQGS